MAFTPFTKDDRPTMAAFNDKFISLHDELVKEIKSVEASGLKIETGTFFISGGDPSVTFQFTPKVVFIRGVTLKRHTFFPYIFGADELEYQNNGSTDKYYVSVKENTLTFLGLFGPVGEGQVSYVAIG